MKLSDRVDALEKRLDALEGEEVRYQERITRWAEGVTNNVNERFSAIIEEVIKNLHKIIQLGNEQQEHFKSHSNRKKRTQPF